MFSIWQVVALPSQRFVHDSTADMQEMSGYDHAAFEGHPARQRLLVVAGQPAGLRPVTGLLSTRFALTFATDGLSGVHRAQGQRPDLVLMDTCLPGVVDGLVACRLLKADGQTAAIPVLLMSDLTEPDDRVRGLEAGAADYICKPLWPAEVLARVRVHLPDAALPVPEPLDPELAHVSAAKSLIEAQLATLPSAPELARQVGVGARRLRELFRRHTGLTLQAYISEQRIRASLPLLEKTSMSVNGVAFEVGFRTPGNFSTAFRARTGMTPQAWRRQRALGF
ncbi:MAG: helix-turn-helix domain-containing protein [Burkholderiales bacterium]|nr:MAG: helix-turn-helix domain-containing protein [Burkholderiales bacterium]